MASTQGVIFSYIVKNAYKGGKDAFLSIMST
jgi:hypothetical protein